MLRVWILHRVFDAIMQILRKSSKVAGSNLSSSDKLGIYFKYDILGARIISNKTVMARKGVLSKRGLLNVGFDPRMGI